MTPALLPAGDGLPPPIEAIAGFWDVIRL